ncbi:hypothetical protein [Flagellimonas lutimaris]|tara:strand:- start:1079 stop:1201 length:123 start_codon:yes stop_codon:yes gene_type:complete
MECILEEGIRSMNTFHGISSGAKTEEKGLDELSYFFTLDS